jgi:CysZ protein
LFRYVFEITSGGGVHAMLDAAVKALAQMFSPPFRTVLWKSIGLALLLIVLIGIGLNHLFSWLADAGEGWADGALGSNAQLPLYLLAKVLSLAAVLGIVLGSVFLMPAVTALVASLFVDEIAEEVERSHYPDQPVGRALPLLRALIEGVKTALLAVLVYLVALPFLLVAGLGVLIFFFATAFLLSREYFLLAAMRFHPPHEARRLRKTHHGAVFLGGLFIAAFVSIPVVNLATPLFGMAFMVHVHKRLAHAPSLQHT